MMDENKSLISKFKEISRASHDGEYTVEENEVISLWLGKPAETDNKYAEFGNRLKILREERGIKQGQFADAIGISRQSMSNYESGKFSPDVEVVKKIAKYFNCSTDFLLGLSVFRENKVQQFHAEDMAKLSEFLLTLLPSNVGEAWRGVFLDLIKSIYTAIEGNDELHLQALNIIPKLTKIINICVESVNKQRGGTATCEDVRIFNNKRQQVFHLLRSELEGLDNISYNLINGLTDTGEDNTVTQ